MKFIKLLYPGLGVFQKRQLKKGPKLVVIGGGTGLSVLLRGLKKHTNNLTAVVTVTDDGGSSGRLRGELGMLPPGDIRNCLLALADEETLMDKLLNFRFSRGHDLKGHNLGNLIIAAMNEITGDFYKAIQELSRVLAVEGEVMPSTLQPIQLKAKMQNGEIVTGETNIVNYQSKIEEVFLNNENCKTITSVIDAINEADAVILGPGSLYTSVIPNLLVKDIIKSIKESEAPLFYVCNIMTQPGETDNYNVLDHLEALKRHTESNIVNYLIVNIEKIPNDILKRYQDEGSEPVLLNEEKIKDYNIKLIKSKLLKKQNFARHDHEKLAHLIMNEISKMKTGAEKIKMFGSLFKVR